MLMQKKEVYKTENIKERLIDKDMRINLNGHIII